MKIKIPYVYAARRRVGGVEKVYLYHRPTKTRLPDDPKSPEFLDAVAKLNREHEAERRHADAAHQLPGSTTNAPGAVGARGACPSVSRVAVASSPQTTVSLPDRCFKSLFDRYRASSEFSDLKASTQAEYGRHMKHVEPVIGLHAVAAFEADLMDLLIAKFVETPALQSGIRRTMSVVLGFAVRILKWVPINPLFRVQKVRRKGRKAEGVRTPLSEAKIERFRACNPYGSRSRLTFELALCTGLRREDLTKVLVEDIEGAMIGIRTGKSGTFVFAVPSEHVVRALQAFRAEHPEHARSIYALGAQKDGRPVHKRTISAEFEAAATRAELAATERIHSLRYTAATRLFELGYDFDEIAEVTGHSNAAMAKQYCKKRDDAPKRAERLKAFGETPYRPPAALPASSDRVDARAAEIDAVDRGSSAALGARSLSAAYAPSRHVEASAPGGAVGREPSTRTTRAPDAGEQAPDEEVHDSHEDRPGPAQPSRLFRRMVGDAPPALVHRLPDAPRIASSTSGSSPSHHEPGDAC